MDEQLPVTEARARFAELVNIVGYGKKRVVLTRHGKPLVALVPAEAVLQLDADNNSAPVMLDLSCAAVRCPVSLHCRSAR